MKCKMAAKKWQWPLDDLTCVPDLNLAAECFNQAVLCTGSYSM